MPCHAPIRQEPDAKSEATDYEGPTDRDLQDFLTVPESELQKAHRKNVVNDDSHAPIPFPEFAIDPPLCDEQISLIELILAGKNVFYTGPAGCGKSTIMRTFVKAMRDQGLRVCVVAYTGRAALQTGVGGCTLHTFAGWVPASMKKPIAILKERAHGKKVWK